jgi:hypothetical protein
MTKKKQQTANNVYKIKRQQQYVAFKHHSGIINNNSETVSSHYKGISNDSK